MPSLELRAIDLAALLPPGVTHCYSASLPNTAQLLPAEEQYTTSMVAKRRAEFIHGRHCSRVALAALGQPAVAILKGNNREPLWPDNVTGSITHTGAAALAVTAKRNTLDSIGIDMEQADPLQDNLLDMICRPEENPSRDGQRAKLLFSCKEAIYKCLYPLVGSYIDFLEMEVRLRQDRSEFVAIAHTEKCPQELCKRMQGRYLRQQDKIICVAWLASSD